MVCCVVGERAPAGPFEEEKNRLPPMGTFKEAPPLHGTLAQSVSKIPYQIFIFFSIQIFTRPRVLTVAAAAIAGPGRRRGRCELRRSPGPGPRRGGRPELWILGLAVKAHDPDELEARLTALEKTADELTHRPGRGPN